MSAGVEAQDTAKVPAKIAAVKPYEIVFFRKGTGKSVLPLRHRLKAEKKRSCGQAVPTQGSPKIEALVPHHETLSLLHQTCWWSGSTQACPASDSDHWPHAGRQRAEEVDLLASSRGAPRLNRSPLVSKWVVGTQPTASAFFQSWPDGLRLAEISNSGHIRDMASRKPASVISKLDDDLVYGAALGLLVFLGLMALLALFYFGV